MSDSKASDEMEIAAFVAQLASASAADLASTTNAIIAYEQQSRVDMTQKVRAAIRRLETIPDYAMTAMIATTIDALWLAIELYGLDKVTANDPVQERRGVVE